MVGEAEESRPPTHAPGRRIKVAVFPGVVTPKEMRLQSFNRSTRVQDRILLLIPYGSLSFAHKGNTSNGK